MNTLRRWLDPFVRFGGFDTIAEGSWLFIGTGRDRRGKRNWRFSMRLPLCRYGYSIGGYYGESLLKGWHWAWVNLCFFDEWEFTKGWESGRRCKAVNTKDKDLCHADWCRHLQAHYRLLH